MSGFCDICRVEYEKEHVCAKCPPITKADIDQGVREIQKTTMERARYVHEVGPLAVAIDLTKAISLMDIAKTMRSVGNGEAADATLERARNLMLDLLGIKPDA